MSDLSDITIDVSRDRLAPLDEALLPRVGPPPGPVIAGVIWYKQTDRKLERLIEACAEHGISGIVFVDGPYAGLSPEECSPAESYAVIRNTCRKKNMAFRSYKGRVWTSEPMKRTASARYALEMSRDNHPGEQPWFLYLDSDEFPMGPIDWGVVGRYGWGTIRLRNWDNQERVAGQGDGATMSRLFPNSPGLVFGPAHYDIRDNDVPVTYLGWEKALFNDHEPCFELGHDFAQKANEAEYQHYNDMVRYKAEGKVMRVISNFREHGEMVVRMDSNSAEMAGWRPGFVSQFQKEYMVEPYVYAVAVSVEYVEDGQLVDIRFEPLGGDEVAAAQVAYDKEKAEKEEVMSEKMQKRIRKRARQWERTHGPIPHQDERPR